MREYVARNSAIHAAAITILQLTAPAATSFDVVRAWVTQSASTTSAQAVVQLNRKSAAATVTALTPVRLNTGDPVSVVTAGHTATAEGTDTDILIREGFNVLSGWLYLPVPEERITVRPGETLALKFPTAPASHTWEYGITYIEV